MATTNAQDEFNVEISLHDASGAMFAERMVRGGFEDGGILVHAVRFDNTCIGGGTCQATTPERRPQGSSLDELCVPDIVGSDEAAGLFSDQGDPRFSAAGYESWFFGFYDRLRDVDDTYTAEEFTYGSRVGFEVDIESSDQLNGNGCWSPSEGCDEARFVLRDDTPATIGVPHRDPSSGADILLIRRWIAPRSACVTVRFTLAFRDPPCRPGIDAGCVDGRDEMGLTDGVNAFVWQEGRELGTRYLNPYDVENHRSERVVFEAAEVCVARGERLDFGVDGAANSAFDPVAFRVDLVEIAR